MDNKDAGKSIIIDTDAVADGAFLTKEQVEIRELKERVTDLERRINHLTYMISDLLGGRNMGIW